MDFEITIQLLEQVPHRFRIHGEPGVCVLLPSDREHEVSADKVILLIVDHVLHGFKCLVGLDVIADVHPDLGVFRPRAAKHHQADVTE